MAVLASQEYVTALRGMLIRVINEGYKLEDKCLRNELVILVNYLLALPEAVPLFLHKENSKEKEEKGK